MGRILKPLAGQQWFKISKFRYPKSPEKATKPSPTPLQEKGEDPTKGTSPAPEVSAKSGSVEAPLQESVDAANVKIDDSTNVTPTARASKRESDQAIRNREYAAGRNLFGIDEKAFTSEPGRWRGEFDGTLAGQHPTVFKVGDWGCTAATFRTIAKVSDTECLVWPKDYPQMQVMLLRGFDMSNFAKGIDFRLQHAVTITGTYSYTNLSGAQKTVLVLSRKAIE